MCELGELNSERKIGPDDEVVGERFNCNDSFLHHTCRKDPAQEGKFSARHATFVVCRVPQFVHLIPSSGASVPRGNRIFDRLRQFRQA